MSSGTVPKTERNGDTDERTRGRQGGTQHRQTTIYGDGVGISNWYGD